MIVALAVANFLRNPQLLYLRQSIRSIQILLNPATWPSENFFKTPCQKMSLEIYDLSLNSLSKELLL